LVLSAGYTAGRPTFNGWMTRMGQGLKSNQ
jgi:hypothetical protein